MSECIRPFVKKVPFQILLDFLYPPCNIMDNILYIDKFTFDLINTNRDKIIIFLSKIKKYYQPSKRMYLFREFNYKSFSTILRQICRINDVKYISKYLYEKSKPLTCFYVDLRGTVFEINTYNIQS